MGFLRIAVFVIGVHYVFAGHSHDSYTIPIEGYETKLHDLVKIPVPYPVKVKEKVPYPVHVSKPYPVPVPQIIKVPHVVTVPQKDNNQQEGGWSGNSGDYGSSSVNFYPQQQGGHLDGEGQGHGRAYEVQNVQSYAPSSDGYSFGGADSNQGHDEGSSGFSYQPQQVNYGFQQGGDDSGKSAFASDTQSYDDALNDYFKKQASESHGYGGGQPSYNEEHSQY